MEESTKVNQGGEMRLLPEAVSSLNEIRKWTMFFTVMGFIGIGIMLMAGIFMGVIFSATGMFTDQTFPAGVGIAISLLYIVIAAVYFFPVFYLLKFSTKTKKAIEEKNDEELASSVGFLKSHYKFVGIMTIVFLALYPLLIIALVAAGVMSGL
ncbi:MAG: hypothetical protein V2I37_13240 [Marinilabiliaceae bacterium]|jgi:hypothetical protein|nr:hypothetical protein [Marinilabiliaceae bacterium]